METLARIAFGAALCFSAATASAQAVPANGTVGTAATPKNWTAPSHRMLAQALVDETMAKHPELLSLTLQGEPPGHKDVHTMFAGSFPERIGKKSSDVDSLVITKGYSILDPRWKMNDSPRKSTYLLPLRDKAGQNIGLAVIVFKNPAATNKTEKEFFPAAAAIRDELAARTPSHAALFAPIQ